MNIANNDFVDNGSHGAGVLYISKMPNINISGSFTRNTEN